MKMKVWTDKNGYFTWRGTRYDAGKKNAAIDVEILDSVPSVNGSDLPQASSPAPAPDTASGTGETTGRASKKKGGKPAAGGEAATAETASPDDAAAEEPDETANEENAGAGGAA